MELNIHEITSVCVLGILKMPCLNLDFEINTIDDNVIIKSEHDGFTITLTKMWNKMDVSCQMVWLFIKN